MEKEEEEGFNSRRSVIPSAQHAPCELRRCLRGGELLLPTCHESPLLWCPAISAPLIVEPFFPLTVMHFTRKSIIATAPSRSQKTVRVGQELSLEVVSYNAFTASTALQSQQHSDGPVFHPMWYVCQKVLLVFFAHFQKNLGTIDLFLLLKRRQLPRNPSCSQYQHVQIVVNDFFPRTIHLSSLLSLVPRKLSFRIAAFTFWTVWSSMAKRSRPNLNWQCQCLATFYDGASSL